jgi:hypothetical protein
MDEEADEEEYGERDDVEICECGYYCFDCLGMSWADFM